MKVKNLSKKKCEIISKFSHSHPNGDVYEHFCKVHNYKWKAQFSSHTYCVIRPDIRKKIWGNFNPFKKTKEDEDEKRI